ncbi:hypothetical protein [Novosphingobium sp. HII-3]|uniref:hypothetical protein n=1 Tax=Novosphingobium sp. HII-3 TaxID=2075565 RepID=UPI0011AF759F|nr:hypothetical protein [Novosphingobium sp. HII-3]
MTNLIQVIDAEDNPTLSTEIENILISAGFSIIGLQVHDSTEIPDAGAEMVGQIQDNLINPTQVFILPADIVDRSHVSDRFIEEMERDRSDRGPFGEYPPVILVSRPLLYAPVRPNIFTVSEFRDLTTDQITKLFSL